MFKQPLLKLAIALAILASLIGGISAESSAAAAQVAPAHPLLVCASGQLPPCV